MTIQYGDTQPGGHRLTRTWIDTAGNVTHSTLDYSSSSAGWLCREGEGEREGGTTTREQILSALPAALRV